MIYKQEAPKVEFKKFKEEEYFPVKHHGFATKTIHAGQEPDPIHGAVNVPVFLSSTYAQKDISEPFGKFDYTRCGNPTREALEKCLAAIEYGKLAIAFSSGCGATATILNTFKTGDHFVVCDDVYGGTQRYMRKFTDEKFGMKCEFVDMSDVSNVTGAIKENTKMVWV